MYISQTQLFSHSKVLKIFVRMFIPIYLVSRRALQSANRNSNRDKIRLDKRDKNILYHDNMFFV